MNWDYCWGILAALFGLAAGFQGIHERYGKDAYAGATTVPGAGYLFSRGLIPLVVFEALLATATIADNLWLWSMVAGTGTESLLRSKFFIRKDDKNPKDDVLWGPFDLVKWYQELALSSIGARLSARRIAFVEHHSPSNCTFMTFANRTLERLQGLSTADVRSRLTEEITKMLTDYSQAPTGDRDTKFCAQLTYLLERTLPRQEFNAIMRPHNS